MKRRPAHDVGIDEEELGRECEAFLRGEYLAWLRAEGLPITGWAHLNRVAHGPIGDRRIEPTPSTLEHVSTFEEAALAIEALVVATTAANELASVQRRVLVPLELDLMSHPVSPRAAVERVARSLA